MDKEKLKGLLQFAITLGQISPYQTIAEAITDIIRTDTKETTVIEFLTQED
jgi:hypothetical protein